MIPQTFILMGRSGCGKGTQAKLLEAYLTKERPEFPVFYLESGQRFREFINNGTYTSELARAAQDEGRLQPAFLAIWMWSNIFVENLTGNEHIIVDGTPRKEHEARAFDGALRFYKREMPYFVYVNVSEEWARARLTERGRSDDREKGFVDTKMKWFEEEVRPAIEFFRENPGYRFLDVNGEQTIEAVHQEIISAL